VIALTLLVWWYGLEVYKAAKDYLLQVPFPWSRHYRSSDNCLEGKRGNYQVCSVQYCVQQLCAMQCIHIWTDLTVVCWLDLAFLWLCYVPQCICVRFSFLGLFCVYVLLSPPFPQIDIIGVVVIVWRVRGKTIRSVLCNMVCNNCAQCDAHTYEQTNSS